MKNLMLPTTPKVTLRVTDQTKKQPPDPFALKEPCPELPFREPEIEDINWNTVRMENSSNQPAVRRTLNETNKKTLMLRWHYRLGHMPMKHLHAMAKHGLRECSILVSRPSNNTLWMRVQKRLKFVHLHETNDGDAIIDGKLNFERFAGGHGVKIRHYHCDNGIFADKAFKVACKAGQQTISFCVVYSHHQSGIAEKRIYDIMDCARSMLLLAKHNWPAAITPHLWGFAMSYATTIRASTLQEGEKGTPL